MALMTLVLAWHGAGAPLEQPDECRCEEAGALEGEPTGNEGIEHAHDTCPPDCEDCPCCGSVTMLAAPSSSAVESVPIGSATLLRWMDQDAPHGERGDVFRPPRA